MELAGERSAASTSAEAGSRPAMEAGAEGCFIARTRGAARRGGSSDFPEETRFTEPPL